MKYERFFHKKNPVILKHILLAFDIHIKRDFMVHFANFAKFYKILVFEEAGTEELIDFFLKVLMIFFYMRKEGFSKKNF